MKGITVSDNALPTDRSYTEEHEWILIPPGGALPVEPARVGITSVAVEALGDLVFIDLPEVESEITIGESCGEVESTKTVSELYPPASGRVCSVNDAVVSDPSLISSDPYGEGWLFTVLPTAAGDLLTAAEYAEKNGVVA